jgi:Zn-dependent protease with chaperone function
METSTYEINSRENFYLGLRALFSLGFYYFIAVFFVLNDNPLFAPIKGIIYVYVAVIIFLVLLQSGLMIGYLKGNGILLGEHQFPAVYNTVTAQAEALGISKVPDVYLVQAGGLLNAFATRFSGRNYIVIYSDLFEAAYEQNKAAVDFVLAHELGHIKRNHMLKNLLTFPAFLVPFLGTAYSRACEYTCDSIGHALSPNGAKNGLLL